METFILFIGKVVPPRETSLISLKPFTPVCTIKHSRVETDVS